MHGPSGEGECTVGTEGKVYKGTVGTLGRNHTVNRRPSGSVAGFKRSPHSAGPGLDAWMIGYLEDLRDRMGLGTGRREL